MANQKLTREDILAALSKVQEPELHKDLVSLNMIRDLEIKGERVSFTIMLTTPACPLRAKIENESRQAVLALGAKSVDLKVEANVPGDRRSPRPVVPAGAECSSGCFREGRGRKKYGSGQHRGDVSAERRSGRAIGCGYLWSEHPNHDGS